MNPPKHNNRIAKLIVLILLSNLLLANFGMVNFAQAAAGRCYDYSNPAVPVALNPAITEAQCNVTDYPPGGQLPATSVKWILDTPPPAPPLPPQSRGNVTLTLAKDLAAQSNPAECKKYSDDVSYVLGDSDTPQAGQLIPKYKAIYLSAFDDVTNFGCYIVPGDFGPVDSNNTFISGGNGTWYWPESFSQPPGAAAIQAKIRAGQGISSDDIQAQVALDQASTNAASTLSKIIGEVLTVIIRVITNVVGWLTAMVGGIFTYTVSQMTKATVFPPAVTVGWAITRDIANMMFILVLIAIALGSILRLEEYDYKKLLPKVILMALLVNFSKVISLTLIDFANVVVRIFAINYTDIQNLFVYNIGFVASLNQHLPNGVLAALGDSIGELIFALISFFAFVVLSGMFIIRLVGIYVLVVLSPMAYALNILPVTEQYAKQWWTHFIKYLIWAPVALFFVKLSLLIAKTGVGDIGASDNSALRYFVVAAFMLAGVMVAKQAGMVGGDMIMSGVKGAMMKTGKVMGGAAAGFAGRTYSKWVSGKIEKSEGDKSKGWGRFWKTAQFANFRVAKEAYEHYTKDKEEEAYVPAVGRARDTIGRVMPSQWHRKEEKYIDEKTGEEKTRKTWKFGLGQKTFYGRIAQQSMINKKIKEWTEANLSEEEKNEAIQNAHHAEDIEAIESVQIKGRHEDGDEISLGLARRKERQKEIYDELVAGGEKPETARLIAETRAKDEIEAEFDVVDHLDTTVERLRAAGLSESQIATRVAHQDELGEAEQKIRAIGNSVWEEHEGKFRTANDLGGYAEMEKQQGSAAMLRSLANLEMVNTHAVEVAVKDKDGNVVTDAEGKLVKQVTAIQFTDNEGNVTAMVHNYDELQAAIHKTTGKNREEKVALREGGADIRYNIIGARKSDSADKRMKRGDTERWSKAHEPAAYMVQNEQGKFIRFTSFGAKRFSSVDGASVNAFKKTRGVQARVAKLAGIYQDAEGKYDIDNFNMDVMEQALRLNYDFTSAIISKSDLEDDVRKEIIAEMKRRGVDLIDKDIQPAR